MSNIKFTGTSNFEAVKKDYDSLAKKTAKLELENRKLKQTAQQQGQAIRGAGKSQGSMISSGLTGLASMAAGWMSVGAAVNLASEAIREQRQLQKEALDVNVSAAGADAQVIKNLVGESSQTKLDTLAALQQMAEDAGVESSVPVKLGFSAAISKASGDRELALSATQRAAELNALAPDDIQTFAGGGVQLSKLIGTQDPREALGFMSEVQARSPVVDPAELMRELPGAIAAITATDDRGAGRESVREAGALFAALGQAAQQKAAPTSTASIQLSGQLAEFFDQQQEAGKLQDPGTLAGRVAAVQESPELQAEILPTLTGEAKFKESFKQLLRGESIISAEFRKNLSGDRAAGLAPLAISAEQFEIQKGELGQQGLTPQIRLASQRSQDLGQAEGQKLEATHSAQAARLAEMTAGQLDQSSTGLFDYADRRWTALEFEARRQFGTHDAAIAALEQREAQIREPAGLGIFRMGLPGLAIRGINAVSGSSLLQSSDEDLGPEELEKVQGIRAAIERLRAERDAMLPGTDGASTTPVQRQAIGQRQAIVQPVGPRQPLGTGGASGTQEAPTATAAQTAPDITRPLEDLRVLQAEQVAATRELGGKLDTFNGNMARLGTQMQGDAAVARRMGTPR